MDAFKIQEHELAGFSLAGQVYPSNVIKIEGSERFIDTWPEEITLLGETYTLETVIDGNVDETTGLMYQNAEYV